MAADLADVSSIDEAADYLRIGANTLVQMARTKKIGSLKIGRTLTFPRAAIEEYVASHTVSADPNQWGVTDATLKAIRDGSLGRKA